MFNALLSVGYWFCLTVIFFLIFTVFRHLFCKSKKLIFAYHTVLFILLFFFSVVGGSVQNDAYLRLEEFIALEESGSLEYAKQNPQNYSSMLQIDLREFANSTEFRNDIKQYDKSVDPAEALFISWLFVFLTDLSLIIVFLIRRIFTALKIRIFN